VPRDGLELHARRGSHQRYRHPDGRRVTVSFHHPGQNFPPKTLRTMIEGQAGWREADLADQLAAPGPALRQESDSGPDFGST
jgi:predicted RNA binding protein YcfA (HicA-like mRNA interferase family)